MNHAWRVTRRAVLAAVAGALAVPGAAPAGSYARAVVDRQTLTLAPREGQRWSVAADVAAVRVRGDRSRHDVRIDVARHAPAAADLARLPLLERESAAGPEVILRQSDGVLDPALRAELTITTPGVGSHGVVSVVEGAIEVHGFHGRLDAEVRRGPITAADVAGVLRLQTTIGAIAVTAARLPPGGLVRLRAFNGDVQLAFAEWPQNARVMALALNGTIQSAIPLTMKDGWGPRWGEATVGSGEDVVSLDVVTGRIRIDAPPPR